MACPSLATMAYDEVLAQRLHDLLDAEPGLSTRAMFGGLGFMLDGHMAVAAGSGGSLMVRVDPVDGDAWSDGTSVRPMEMRGRTMNGWLLVDGPEARRRRPAAALGRAGRGLRAQPAAQGVSSDPARAQDGGLASAKRRMEGRWRPRV